MKRSKLIATAATALVSMALVGGSIAIAGSNGGPQDANSDRAEVNRFLSSPTSLTNAIKTAEGETGGRAVVAEFNGEDKISVFEITTLNGDAVTSVEIDTVTGKVVDTEKEGMLSRLINDDPKEFAGLSTMKLSLTELISRAEAKAGGKVMDINFEADDMTGKAAPHVEVARADGTSLVLAVNPGDGSMTVVADADRNGDDMDHDDDDDR